MGLKVPVLPSLKLTLTPAVGVPLTVARVVSAVGRVLPAAPVWLLPPFAAKVLTAAVAVSEKVAAV